MNPSWRAGILIVGIFAIACGIGEMVVGYTGNYLGILAAPIPPSPATVIVGACYAIAGLCILTLRKPGAALGIAFLGAEILGRVYLVAIGIAPARGADLAKVIVGGLIAGALILFVVYRWRDFE